MTNRCSVCVTAPTPRLRDLPPAVCTESVSPKLVVALLFAATALAQDWQVGASLGYGWYRKARVNGPGAEAEVGIRNRFTAGSVITEDLYEHISGEVRYM